MVAEGQIVIDAIRRRALDVLLDEDPLIRTSRPHSAPKTGDIGLSGSYGLRQDVSDIDSLVPFYGR